jgi:hypothetical protein
LPRRRAFFPGQLCRNTSFNDARRPPPHRVHRHGVDDFVRDHDASKALRKVIEEFHSAAEPRRLALAQRAARLEDQVVPLELPAESAGKRSAPRAELENRAFELPQLPGQRSSEQAAELRRGDEVSLRAELPVAASIVGLQRELHVAREGGPAALRRDLRPDSVGEHAKNLP